jgi:predicted MFS family arabinose efflux permease
VSGHKVRAAARDKLQIIKDYARKGKFDILLVFMFDRIGRIADETPFVVAAFFLVAFAGYFATVKIKANELPTEPSEAGLRPFRFLLLSYRRAKAFPAVNIAVFGSSAFWLIGGMLQMNLVIHSKNVYGFSNTSTGLIMALAATGIAAGTLLAGKLSGNQPRKAFVLPGLTGILVFMILLSVFRLPDWLYGFSVFALAMSGGFFQIPLLATLQHADTGRKLGV